MRAHAEDDAASALGVAEEPGGQAVSAEAGDATDTQRHHRRGFAADLLGGMRDFGQCPVDRFVQGPPLGREPQPAADALGQRHARIPLETPEIGMDRRRRPPFDPGRRVDPARPRHGMEGGGPAQVDLHSVFPSDIDVSY